MLCLSHLLLFILLELPLDNDGGGQSLALHSLWVAALFLWFLSFPLSLAASSPQVVQGLSLLGNG